MREAVSAHQGGRLEQAAQTYHTLTTRYPGFPDAWHYYGLLLYQGGDTEKGLESLRRAQALQPDNPAFLINFGRILYELGDFPHAVVCLRQAHKLRPGDPNGLVLLAQALVAIESGGEVLPELEQLGESVKADWQFKMLIGECRDQAGDRAGATAAFDEAARIAPPTETAPLLYKANAAMKAGQTQTAKAGFESALTRDAKCAGAYLGLANLATEAGDFDEAAALSRKAVTCNPRTYEAWTLLAANVDIAAKPDFLKELEHTARETAQDPESWPLHFARGRLLEQQQDYDGAFAAFQQGNRMQSLRHPYSREPQEDYVRGLIEGMNEAFVQRQSDIGVSDPGIIFICGMPRSGTTLVESIITAHPSVAAGGEMRWVHDRLRQSIGMKGINDTGRWLSQSSNETLRELARDWSQVIRDTAGGSPRLTDKMPGNYHHLPLLHVCFPESPIIYVHRDARDNGLSCFTTAFYEGHGFSNELNTIGHYYLLHQQLMERWESILGSERIIRVEYETLVESPETEIRRLLEAVNLPWDPACLEFHHKRRRVSTASVYQVRQPLYSSSIGRWRAYERHLEPLLLALAATPPV